MAFMAGLMGAEAGQGQGRIQAYQDALAQQAQQQTLLEQQREFDAQQKLLAAQSGIDPTTGKPLPPNVPKAFSQILPGNKGKGTPGPNDFVNHYLGLAAANVNNPYGQQYANIAAQYGLGAERSATAAYTAGAKTDQAEAAVQLDNARIQVLTKIQPEQFKAKLGEDRDKYIYNAAAQYDRAQYNAQQRQYLATLNAAFRFQGYSQQDAFRASLQQYQEDSQNWRSELTNEKSPLYQGPQAGNTPPAPNFTINTGGGGGNDSGLMQAIVAAALGNITPQTGGGQQPPPPPAPGNDNANFDAAYRLLKTKPNPRSEIDKAFAAKQITQAERDWLYKRFGFGAQHGAMGSDSFTGGFGGSTAGSNPP